MSNIVEITDAVKTFERGVEEVRALDGVNLRISQGDFLAVVGPSGSGKTTLLNLIGCVDRPTSGVVNVHGMETEELTDRALATIRSTTMGFVFQHFLLMPTLTAVENVMVPGRFSAKRGNDLESRAKKLLDAVGLAGRADHLPRELSGGEMQRVALARALINEPEILLADEPTGNLDTKSADDIAAIFRELNDDGLTIVVVTHNAELAANATRGLRLRDGRIVGEEELRPAAVSLRERETAPEPISVPEYMPATLKKRVWGSPAVAGFLALLGAAMCAAAFMPFLGGQTGFGLMSRGAFTATFYRGNEVTRIYFGSPAAIITGIWPFVLGLLLAAAGALYLFRRLRISGWIAVVTGTLGVFVSTFNLMMIYARLGPEASRNYLGMTPEYGLWTLLGVSVTALASGILIVGRHGRRSLVPDDQQT